MKKILTGGLIALVYGLYIGVGYILGYWGTTKWIQMVDGE